jgi:hypothetical protein
MNNFATRPAQAGLKTEAFNALHVPFDLNHAQLPHRSDNHRADRLAAALQIGADVAGVRGVLPVEWAKQSSAQGDEEKDWIACARGLLAMTGRGRRAIIAAGANEPWLRARQPSLGQSDSLSIGAATHLRKRRARP